MGGRHEEAGRHEAERQADRKAGGQESRKAGRQEDRKAGSHMEGRRDATNVCLLYRYPRQSNKDQKPIT